MSLPLNTEALSDPAGANITHLLNTNNPPDNTEAAVLQKEVDVLVPTVSHLRAQLKLAEAKLLQCRSVLSAIRKFPQEILVQVFTFAIGGKGWKTRRGALVQLGRVSKAWHGAAYDPSLWADVIVKINDIRSPEDIEVMFRNSKSYPRTVTLQGRGCGCGNPEETPCAHPWRVGATELLYGSSPIRRLEIVNSSMRSFKNLIASLDGDPHRTLQAWCSLQSLGLDFDDFPESPSTFNKLDSAFDFSSLPLSLRTFRIRLPSCPRGVIPRFKIDPDALKRLTSLSLQSNWDTFDVLAPLRHATNLTVLHLGDNYSTQSWRDATPGSDVLLPKLHTLDLNIYDIKAAAVTLPLLKLPALANLRIFTRGFDPLREALENLRIISSEDPLAPSLGSLSIWYRNWMGVPSHIVDGTDLVDILSSIPSLQHLSLDKIMFDAQEFTDLVSQGMQDGRPPVLPSIKSIELIDAETIMRVFDIKEFLRFVEVRRQPSRLQSPERAEDRPDTLRRITIGSRRKPDGSASSYKRLVAPWEEAVETIQLLEETYGVVVDKVFVSSD